MDTTPRASLSPQVNDGVSDPEILQRAERTLQRMEKRLETLEKERTKQVPTAVTAAYAPNNEHSSAARSGGFLTSLFGNMFGGSSSTRPRDSAASAVPAPPKAAPPEPAPSPALSHEVPAKAGAGLWSLFGGGQGGTGGSSVEGSDSEEVPQRVPAAKAAAAPVVAAVAVASTKAPDAAGPSQQQQQGAGFGFAWGGMAAKLALGRASSLQESAEKMMKSIEAAEEARVRARKAREGVKR